MTRAVRNFRASEGFSPFLKLAAIWWFEVQERRVEEIALAGDARIVLLGNKSRGNLQ